MKFTVIGRNVERFDAFVATHNSKHKKVITIEDKSYTVGADGPYCFIGMQRANPDVVLYEFLGDPTELLPVLAAEFKELTFRSTHGEFTITNGKLTANQESSVDPGVFAPGVFPVDA